MAELSEDGIRELAEVLTLFSSCESFVDPYHEQAAQHLKQYKKFQDTKDWPYANRVHTPDTYAFVEDVVAKYCSPYLESDDFLSCKSLPGDRIDLAPACEANINFELRHPRSAFPMEFIDFVRSGAIFGTGFFEAAPNIRVNPMTNLVEMTHINFRTLDFWDIYPDFDCRRLSHDGRFFFKREIVHMDTLRNAKLFGFPYKNLDIALETARTGELPTWHADVLKEMGLEHEAYDFAPDKGYLEILHYHHDGQVKQIANRAVVIFDTEDHGGVSPYIYNHPIVDWRFVSQPNEFYGVGIPWIIRELQEDTNILLSQRRDNVDLAINAPLKVRKGAGLDINTLVYYPGAIWLVNDLDADVEQMPAKDVTKTAYVEEDRNQTRMEDALGEHRYTMGRAPQRRETATGIMRLQQMSLARHDLGVKGLEYAVARAIGRRVLAYIHMYRSKEHFARVAGLDVNDEVVTAFFAKPTEDVIYGMDFRTTGTTLSQVREQRANNAQYMWKMLTGIPPQVAANNVQPFQIDYLATAEHVLRQLEVPNIHRYILKQTAPAAEQQQPANGVEGGPTIDEIMASIGEQNA